MTTTTSLTSSTATPVIGQPVTYTVTVAPVSPGAGTPTGSVDFTGGAGALCTSSLDESSPDQATCTTTYSAPGSDSVTASYEGDSNYAISTSGAVGETIAQDQTTTALATNLASPVVGQNVTYTATVAAVSPGAGTPTGTVTFTNAADVALCTTSLDAESPDQANCTTTYPASGTDAVTATYNGDANDATSSSSPPVAESIGEAATSTSSASSDLTPVVGETVTYTATVVATSPGAGTPTGTVNFTNAADDTLCSSTLDQSVSDQATCNTAYTAPGSDSVTATYVGDGNYSASSSAVVGETIEMSSTTTAISSSPSSPVVGQPVTYTATVAPVAPGAGTPTGAVTFTGSAGSLCAPTPTLSQSSPDTASCTTTYTSALSDVVSAAYAGDNNFATSNSSPLTVSITPAATATNLTVDDANPVVGQSVTFTATVAVSAPGAATPTGTVTFAGGAGTLCSSAIEFDDPVYGNLYDELSRDGSRLGCGHLRRRYRRPDLHLGPGWDFDLPASTTTALATSDSTPVTGEVVTFTATVAASAPGAGTPTGTVTFTDGAGTLCTSALNDGSPNQATCTASFPGVGSNPVTATYNGDSNFTGSASSPTAESISAARTTATLSANVSSSVINEQITFTAEVNTVAPGVGAPVGVVTFTQKSGSKTSTLCASTLSDSTPDVATSATSYASIGNRTVRATYAGNEDFVGSVSNTFDVSVAQAATTTSLVASPAPSVTGQGLAPSPRPSRLSPRAVERQPARLTFRWRPPGTTRSLAPGATPRR